LQTRPQILPRDPPHVPAFGDEDKKGAASVRRDDGNPFIGAHGEARRQNTSPRLRTSRSTMSATAGVRKARPWLVSTISPALTSASTRKAGASLFRRVEVEDAHAAAPLPSVEVARRALGDAAGAHGDQVDRWSAARLARSVLPHCGRLHVCAARQVALRARQYRRSHFRRNAAQVGSFRHGFLGLQICS
jgi:hypothetical protein